MRILKHGILARAWLVMLLAFGLASIASIAFTVAETNLRYEKAINTQLNQSVDTVLANLQTACYLKDADLAQEVAKGLLSHAEILRVKIDSLDTTLGDRSRNVEQGGADNLGWKVIRRSIPSPFKPAEIVGVIYLYPNPAVIDGLRKQDVELAIKQLIWQLLFVSLAACRT